jgi:hypothetical protein
MATAPHPAPAVRLFYSYARLDEDLRRRMEGHLSLLKRNGVIVSWHDREILAGAPWAGAIDQHLEEADVILLLISSFFLASDYCFDIEMKRALERQKAGQALVIPIILRPVDWHDAPFARLQCLPRNALPVTAWRDPEAAFADVAAGIRRAVETWRSGAAINLNDPSPEGWTVAKERVLDAAIPSRVTVGEPVEVLTLLATTDSQGLRGVIAMEQDAYDAKPEDVRSSKFDLEFPVDERGRAQPVAVTVALESADFEPARIAKKVFVPPNRDSTVCTLFVKPKHAGMLTAQLELELGDTTVLSHRLKTTGESPTLAGGSAGKSYTLTRLALTTAATPPMPQVLPPAPAAAKPAGLPTTSAPPAPRKSGAAWKAVSLLGVAILGIVAAWNYQGRTAPPPPQSAPADKHVDPLEQARTAYDAKRYFEALWQVEKIQNPSVDAIALKGRIYFGLERFEDAKRTFEEALRLAPGNTEYAQWLDLADHAIASKQNQSDPAR